MPFSPFLAASSKTTTHPLDLNTLLVPHPASSYFFRVDGNAMQHMGVFDQDLLLIDRSLSPQNGQLVLISNADEFQLKTFQKQGDKIVLYSANKKIKPIEVNEAQNIEILGVVTVNIHPFIPLAML